ncbi:hypothetical protein QUB27_21635 [Microcoleus sp. AT8-B6]|uniref:S8 family serine peptidase n=1 Tax=Microcoleus sp. AT8-B6 TaxID=2818622 RepID=UPI002FCFFF77
MSPIEASTPKLTANISLIPDITEELQLTTSTKNYSDPPKNPLTTNETSSTNSSIELSSSNNQILDKNPENSPQPDTDAFILNKNPTPTTNKIPQEPQTSTTKTDPITGDTAKPATQNNISFDSGIFQADETGKIVFDYLSDGGWYQGELAIISLTGMPEFVPDSQAFILEAARRALSNSSLGYIAISDSTEAASFSSLEGENNFNIGEYRGIKTFAMTPGDELGIILVPNGKIQEAYNNPAIGGDKKPLFSMATANSSDAFQRGQIASVANGGSIFVMEDMGIGEGSHADYNDIIFSLKGATPKVISMDDVIAKNSDWRTSEKGKELIAGAAPKTETKLEDKKADTTSATNPVETKPENSPATETENPTISENPNSDPNSAEIKTENSSATETENPTISENPNSDPNSAETKTDSPAVETKNPTVSENPNSEPNPADPKTDSPTVETENPTISENPNSDPNSAEIKTENSSATETENPTVSEIPNSDPNPVETKTENSSAGETENPTISENPNSDPNSAETKTENSSATETENPTISENPNSEPNPAETKTDSPAVETENPTISENPNSDPNSAETKTENSPAGETENPTISENIISIISENTQPAIAVVNSIDFITGDKIETPVFFQPDKPEISAIPAESTDILTGEIENISPTLIDTPEIASQTPENFPLISPEEISQLWESLNSILAQQFPNIPETESSQNHQPSASEYIVTDAQTIIPEIAVTENHHSQQSENITAGSDNQPPTTIDEYVNPDFDSENIAITPEIPSDANNQPDNSLHIIADSEIATATDSDSETTINEYAITDTKTKLEITPNLPQQNQPLIGIIDTGFTTNNPNINYSQIFLGKDLIEGDNNPLLQPNQANQHGDTILEIISHSNNQSDTKKSTPIWLGRAIGSGNWHQSLIEFVDTAKASKQPNAVVNLSFDLTQINPDGTQTTRYQLTAEEKSALKYAHDNNILIVAAAGNEGDLASALGQASTEFDNIITVGASDNNNRAAYSSYGGGLDILAPTSLTQTAEPSTTETKQGTSIAAAFVTKTISQMWAANPSLNRQQIKNILLKTATDIDVPSWDERTGYGILNRELAIATATETIPTIPVLAAVKQLTKSLIDADANVSNSPNNSTAKPSERATATNAPGTPKTTSTSTGDYNQGTSSYTTELAPYRTTSTSNYNGTNSTNSQTNSNFSNTESSWDKSTVKTNTKGNSFNESISDSSTNAATYTSKNFSQNSVENKNQSQQKYSRVKYEGTRADQSSSNQKSRSSTNYTTPSQTTNTTAESYRNSFSQSDSKYGTGYAMNNGKRQDDWGSKSTSNTRNTSSTGSSLSNSSTQVQGKADWTNSSNGSSSNNTHSGEETTVTKSDSQSSNTSGFSKTNNSGDNYSVINSTWDNSTINGKAVNSNTRDVYSEGNSNSNSSYDDGKSKNTSNRDTYTVNQSQQTNSSNGPAYWQNNRNNNYSVTQGNDTQNYKNGPSTSSHNRDTYSVSKSNSSSSNSSGKVSSKNQQENYSENNAQWESEYKADTYTTQSNSDESTITATKSNSSTEGSNSNSSNSSDTYRTRNSQTVTTYKDGRKTENGGSTYEKWSSESTYDSKGLVSSISKYSTWSSSYSRNYFKGGYSWSETLSGYDSESGTKGGVSTSNGSSWSWTRSGTVWDDGRNNWSESWSKSSWKDGKYAPGESESKRGAFDPKKTTPQVNDVPSFGDAPRLTKAPKKQVPIDLQKPPKPSDDIWTPPRRTVTPPREVENFPDNWVAGPGGGSSPNQDKIQKFLREFRRVMAQGKRAVIDFLKGFIYHSLINGVGLLKDVADLLYPPGAKSHAEIEAYYRNNLSFQLGRAVANGLTFLAGILGILLIGLTIGGSGGSALIAAPAQAAALIVAGNMTAASARDILSLVGQVFQMTSGNSGGSSSIPNPDRTRPSLNPDPNRQPSGSKTIPEPKADELNIRGIARENESAEILSKAGYNVEQNPTVSGTRRPDYKIEGRIFDCYAPITSDPNKIISALKDKIVKGQADRFILNLDDSKVSLADILVHLNRYPAPSIREIIVVRGGTILHFFQ